MNSLIIPQGIADYPVLCVRFRMGSLGVTLPEYAGGVLRGSFGMALKKISATAWDALFGSQNADDLFVPYMLVPPAMGVTSLAPGDTFDIELRLFGEAVKHFSACKEALALLGKLGLGRERGKYALLGIAPVQIRANNGMPQPIALQPVDSHIQPTSLADWFYAVAEPIDRITINLITPLRLKRENHLLGDTPSFDVLWSRVYARVSLALGRSALSADHRSLLAAQSRDVVDSGSRVKWIDWSRYSARQEQTMKFGGLIGSLQYEGPLLPFLPWVSSAQVLGLGGKTTFGLGCIQLSV